ncbi:hypothetical protein AAG570_001690 [Ranatra chinensis]|uniref:UV radiation resistance-associated gene protein n=1 Tax=Ranatra chinensis TaxID=642074 RepID=A0ABD0Y9A9_9HEMI
MTSYSLYDSVESGGTHFPSDDRTGRRLIQSDASLHPNFTSPSQEVPRSDGISSLLALERTLIGVHRLLRDRSRELEPSGKLKYRRRAEIFNPFMETFAEQEPSRGTTTVANLSRDVSVVWEVGFDFFFLFFEHFPISEEGGPRRFCVVWVDRLPIAEGAVGEVWEIVGLRVNDTGGCPGCDSCCNVRRCDMSNGVAQRGTVRWKEWVPLVSQQQRLRSLIQVIAYNVQVDEKLLKREKGVKWSYYYTIHLTTMSSPLYTSERLESDNPKWAEIEINQENGAVNGIVIRLWVHPSGGGDDQVITVWGVHLSGLVYVGGRLLCADPSLLGPNTLVFHMHGGYFTAPHCFLQPHPATPRTLTVQLPASQVKPSYTLKLLLRLHRMQLVIKKQAASAKALRDRICEGTSCGTGDAGGSGGGSSSGGGTGGLTLRRLLQGSGGAAKKSPEMRRRLLDVRRQIELVRFRVNLLTQEKDRAQGALRKLTAAKDVLAEDNQDKRGELMERYCCLRKEIEQRRWKEETMAELRSQLTCTNSALDVRIKQLMAQLSYIYPITQAQDGRFLIRGVHLPYSEDFEGKDETMVSVALGFVAHLVQMMAFFLNVPTRYPIVYFGSRSKVIDHINDKIPDKDRIFPLYARSKDKYVFDYGVYLLNKNIAQLRWTCGLNTSDLRLTLPNLKTLMTLNKSQNLNTGLRSERTQSVSEGRSAGPPQPPRRQKAASCSLDGNVDWDAEVATAAMPGSDPQHYAESYLQHQEQKRKQRSAVVAATPLTDLASLMSLDIPNRFNPQVNGDNGQFVSRTNS